MGGPKLQFQKGQRFGRLMIIEKSDAVLWLCKCECGNFTKVRGAALKRGHTKSCGCLIKDTNRKRSITHGLSKHKLYPVWNGMIRRCYNPNNKDFRLYGLRGIKVCERWKKDVRKFIEDMEPSYKPGLSIDRIDNNGNYEPDNCRWATNSQQNMNQSPFGTQKHVGVSYSKPRGRWRGNITQEGKHVHLGYFDTEEEAAQVVKAKRFEVYGI